MSTPVPPGRPPGDLSLDAIGAELRPILSIMVIGPVLITMIGLLMFTSTGSIAAAVGTLLAGLACVVLSWGAPGWRLAPLDPAERVDPWTAASQLRTVALLVMVLAELPAVIGIVVSIVDGGWLPALVGGVVAAGGLLIFGPTKSRLLTWQALLEAHGAHTGL